MIKRFLFFRIRLKDSFFLFILRIRLKDFDCEKSDAYVDINTSFYIY